MNPLINTSGITIRQLKNLVKDLPEIDDSGEDYELWIENTDGSNLSNVATEIWKLNQGDLIIKIN